MSRGALGLIVLVMLGALSACSEPVDGTGTIAAEALVPERSGTVAPTPPPTSPAGAPATGTPAPRPTATPRQRDPEAVARAVEIRATDLPGGWRPIPGSRTGDDSLNWVVACARDAGVSPGTLSGAETPDFSPSGTTRTSQVGTATGLFPDAAAAARFVALFRQRPFGACVAAEAVRAWDGTFRAVPAFSSGPFRVPTAADSAGIGSVATLRTGARTTFQFFAIRTGQIVTMLNTSWTGASDSSIINTVASRIGARQRTV